MRGTRQRQLQTKQLSLSPTAVFPCSWLETGSSGPSAQWSDPSADPIGEPPRSSRRRGRPRSHGALHIFASIGDSCKPTQAAMSFSLHAHCIQTFLPQLGKLHRGERRWSNRPLPEHADGKYLSALCSSSQYSVTHSFVSLQFASDSTTDSQLLSDRQTSRAIPDLQLSLPRVTQNLCHDPRLSSVAIRDRRL